MELFICYLCAPFPFCLLLQMFSALFSRTPTIYILHSEWWFHIHSRKYNGTYLLRFLTMPYNELTVVWQREFREMHSVLLNRDDVYCQGNFSARTRVGLFWEFFTSERISWHYFKLFFKYPLYRPTWPGGVQEVKAPRFLDTRHMKVVRPPLPGTPF